MTRRTNRRTFLSSAVALASAPIVLSAGSAGAAAQKSVSKLRFAVLSDGHFGQPDTDYTRFHDRMVAWLKNEQRGKGLDFVILNGDLIHNDPEFLPQVKTFYDRLEIPYFAVKGNHDMVSPSLWAKTWGYEENHHFEKGDAAFLLGSTSNEKGDYLCADHAWLQKTLSKFAEKKWIFLFLHISQHKFTRHGIDCPKVTELIEKTANLTAVFHGHDHDLDNVIFWNGKSYFFDGHFGGSWGTNYRGYRIVEINADDQVLTYQCNPEAFIVNSRSIG